MPSPLLLALLGWIALPPVAVAAMTARLPRSRERRIARSRELVARERARATSRAG
jgi:hypothetical protein